MWPHFGYKFSFGCCTVWRLSTNFDCCKRGETFGPVARVAISKHCNIEANSYGCNLLLDPEHCYRRVEQFLELPHLPVVRLCVDIVLYNYFSFFLR